jgi:hypothetical protein
VARFLALEEIHEDIGSDLVHGSRVVGGLGGSGQPVDPSHCGAGPMSRKVEPIKIGRAVRIRRARDTTILNRIVIAGLGTISVEENHELAEPGSQLTCRLAWGALQGSIRDALGVRRFEMGGLLDDDPCLGEIDSTLT